MNFELNKEQKQIKKAVKDFVKGEFKKDIIHELIENKAYPAKILNKASELGFLGIHFPEQYGGEALSVFEKILIAEELAIGSSTVGACVSLAGYGTEILLQYGSEKQKKIWLPKVADAEILSSCAFTEPGIGNNIELSQTTAVKDGNSWLINGRKAFAVNGGPLAGFYIVLCKTDSEAGNPEQGLSTMLVEADCQGVSAVDIGNRLGHKLLFISNIEFNNVRIPLENLIGQEHKGYSQVMEFFNHSRLVIAALSVGTAQGAFDRAFAHVKQREQFGQKLIDFQITRHKLAEMITEIENARLMTWQGALACEKGSTNTKLCSMAKLVATRTAMKVCDHALQLLGGYGYVQEYEVEGFYRDAKMSEILEGNQHVQKDVIADTITGKR
ncbi:acyl-CoA dehydrogenase family protein [Desulfobacula sp.]|uniref:acyl-CoA dehydrogenase family protein n=1 Tax=Desulfobacula sp. TaxID=2593537 RepID=UPI00261F5F9F|nr:acyl-CoA dehydrogenase family protein [Desulfobacula sp.]